MSKKQQFSEEDFKRIQASEVKKNEGKTLKKSLTAKVQSELDSAKKIASQEQSKAHKLRNEAEKASLVATNAQKQLAKVIKSSKK